jgi:hypothetical protein
MTKYVKCVENHPTCLTLGKIYPLVSIPDDDHGYQICDDSGNILFYNKSRFIEIDAPEELTTLQPAIDVVNHPIHYTFGGIECLDAIKGQLGTDGFIAFLRGQIAKYNWRIMHKNNSLEDAKKIQFYTNKLVEELEIKSDN